MAMQYSRILIILLFELGFGIKFNLVGVISISELFLLVFVPLFILPKVKWNNKTGVTKVTLAYALLFCFQILSEIIVGNDMTSALKGLAITIVSYLHLMFLVFYLSRQKSLILILIISQMAVKLLFDTSREEQTVEDIVAGEAAAYLKFYLSPLVTLAFLAFSVVYKHKYLSLAFSLLGIIFIVLGARNGGVIALVSGFVTYVLEHRSLVANKKLLITSSVVLCIFAYGLYVYYVNSVLAGEITSGNNRQVFLCKNPYNPFELLLVGRSEVWVGWQAFMDEFWFGHGAWPYDTTGHYQRMMMALHGEHPSVARSQIDIHYLIPSHSVLIGSGMMNGVFALLSMGYIVFYFLWKGVRSFVKCEDRYKLVLVFQVLDLFWATLFSPQSHFRLTMPISFAIIFVMSASVENIKTVEARRSMAVRYTAFRAVKDRVLPRKTRHIGD